MYDCPIKTFFKQSGDLVDNAREVYEGHIVTAVTKIGIDIDKEGLIKAIRNDRTRYEEAYQKGWNDCVRHYAAWVGELAELISRQPNEKGDAL